MVLNIASVYQKSERKTFLYNAFIGIISGFVVIEDVPFLNLLLIALVVISIIFGKTNDTFCLFLILSPFTSAFVVGSKGIFGMLVLLSAIKFISFSKRRVGIGVLIAGLVLMSLEMMNDFMRIPIGIFINVFPNVVFFVTFFAYCDYEKINSDSLLLYLNYTCMLAIFMTFLSTGGNIQNYEYDTASMIRFGETARSISGAMEIPIYTMLSFGSIIIVISKYSVSPFILVLSLFILMAEMYLSVLTLSRVFYVGLFMTVLLFIVFFLIDKKRHKAIIGILLVATLVIILWNSKSGIIMRAIERTANRKMSDFSSGRMDIWKSCFQYLSKHPVRFLFGSGMVNYMQIGQRLNIPFSQSAHNLLLDCIMSFGLVGLVSFMYLFIYAKNSLRRNLRSSLNKLNKIPLLVYLSMQMTGGMLYYFRTFIMLMVLVCIAYGRDSTTSAQYRSRLSIKKSV